MFRRRIVRLEEDTYSGIAKLTAMGIDGASTVDFSQLAFHFGIAKAHGACVLILKNLDRTLVNLAC